MSDSVDDPFALLGLPHRFEISSDQLQVAYLKRAAALHPDRFPDPIRQAQAAQDAARLNRAKAVLADDEQRANALLRQLGGPVKEQDKSLPEGFLVEIMEVRQAIEEAPASNDPSQREHFEKWAHQQRGHYKSLVAQLFAGGPPDSQSLREIRLQLNAWRYIERLIEQLDPDYKLQL
ncbi:MAG: DnaJ domain-containing protein [Phycisphaerales bacterium]|nr:DnaJ domain-containing protein [Phycisphaerales bacterium]MCI0675853.1 DnaJ domain-containing protein [Phycisphaerales bacterium]